MPIKYVMLRYVMLCYVMYPKLNIQEEPYCCNCKRHITNLSPSLLILIVIAYLKHKQANINVKSRRFGVIVTPFSRQSE